jgi:hypothetical protein
LGAGDITYVMCTLHNNEINYKIAGSLLGGSNINVVRKVVDVIVRAFYLAGPGLEQNRRENHKSLYSLSRITKSTRKH